MKTTINHDLLFTQFFDRFPIPMFLTHKNIVKKVNKIFTETFKISTEELGEYSLSLSDFINSFFNIKSEGTNEDGLIFETEIGDNTYVLIISPLRIVNSENRYGYIGAIYNSNSKGIFHEEIMNMMKELNTSLESLKQMRRGD